MKTVTAEIMLELERKTAEALEIKMADLMDQAGMGVARIAYQFCQNRVGYQHQVLLVAGRGNNGGDAFAAARYLKEYGVTPTVWIAGPANEIKGDALTHFSRMKSAKIAFRELPVREDWDDTAATLDARRDPFYTVVVDGVLGTGLKGPARGPAAGAIRLINAMAWNAIVVAIDVPSGLDADTGEAPGEAVLADVTATMGLPKRGLLLPPALNHVGAVEVVDLGVSQEAMDEIESDLELITPFDLRPLFPPRRRDSHKGCFGHVLIIGGAAGYSGAVTMAAAAALRSGTGLVSALVPRCVAGTIASVMPEAMIHPGTDNDAGTLTLGSLDFWRMRKADFTAVAIGPGLTRNPESAALVRVLLRECQVPLLLDADALNVLENSVADISHSTCPVIITPHPGEMGRLLGCDATAIQADRLGAVRRAADLSRATVVLKGTGTLVHRFGEPVHVNMTGNPGMATGGSGDVLSGLLVGLLAQGMAPMDAARVAVYLHGHAGDDAARLKSQHGITAGDIIDNLSYAFQALTPR